MIILPKITIKRGDFPGNQVLVQLPDLSENEKTFLSADEASGQTTLSVVSGTNFAANEYVVIGTPGQEHTEIRLVSSQTTSTIVISVATDFAHTRGTQITFIPFNRIEITNDTDSTFGSVDETATISLRVDALQTFWEDIDGLATTYYRVRFNHEQGSRNSSYSDVVLATGFGDNTVFAVKQRALRSIGQKLGDFDWLTDEWLNQVLWEGRRELEAKLDRWSFRKKFDTDIGNVVVGQNSISVPSDLRDPETAKNLLAVYVGVNRIPLSYITKQEMNEWYRGIAHTTLNGAVLDTDVTITLTSSRDFEESGSIVVGGSSTEDTVAYTSNVETTGVISGVTGIQSGGHATGVDVWQGVSFGLPQYFTVTEDGIQFNQPFADDYYNENVYADYWASLTAIDSDADTFDEPDYDMFVNYLAFRIKKRKVKGEIPLNDDDYSQWMLKSNALISRETSGQLVFMKPDIDNLQEE